MGEWTMAKKAPKPEMAEGLANARAVSASLVSIGYEGRSIDELVSRLKLENVQVLVDVRLTPLSRKPGLSKTRLAETLRAAGIEYVHHRALGNPKDNRDSFRAGVSESRDRFREVLGTEEATNALAHLVELMDGGVLALLCFERDHATCHRELVVEYLEKTVPGVSVVHI
ncbi:DUF488 domain-containing protein [Rhodococcus sp. MSC1_016]|jgi:uncharacterized protein (DUF488 family)|uniref:DUF488 domain-containing protein n=1 Tax=Rhodococcus sp. MSC1_016 TaxID=2909266 RepID=UPI00202E9087|nr:DUF488 domain-containing protein [Rhodococcus sp. MSC1_016]